MHEAKTHRYNSWLTLTYDDAHLPSKFDTGIVHPITKKRVYSGTLVKRDPQQFFRRLRKALCRKGSANHRAFLYTPRISADMGPCPIPREKPNLRYYYGGEYGEKYGRPHYHLCLFNLDFADKKHVQTTDTGFKLYESPSITRLWKLGGHSIGELTWEAAAYTARYIMKKINGKKQQQHYQSIDQETGEIITRVPEFNDMSRKPGIAAEWLERFITDVYPSDQVIQRGHAIKPPRYYDKQYEKNYPAEMEQIRFGREIEAKLNWENHSLERLAAEETITKARIKSLKQKF